MQSSLHVRNCNVRHPVHVLCVMCMYIGVYMFSSAHTIMAARVDWQLSL